jgi:pseudoazurin
MMKLILAACAVAIAGSTTMVAMTAAPAAPPAGKTATKVITVKMLDMGPDGAMSFSPGFVKANVGDTIHFVPANAMHNAETIASMLPDGVAPSAGNMGQAFDLKLTAAGVYGVKCKPHYAMGMVMLVQAGKGPSANLAKAKAAALPPFAKKRIAAYLAKAS